MVRRKLNVCPECLSSLVYPIWWSETDDDCWELELRCPNCEYAEVGVFDHPTVEIFDHFLNVGTDVLLKNLEVLTRANFAGDAKRFIKALEADAILPEDF